MMKTFALAAAAATVALGSSFAGTSSAEAGYYHKRVIYKHVYVPKVFVKKVYKPVVVYKPAVVYKPVKIFKPVTVYKHAYKVW